MSLSRGGFELNEIWAQQANLIEADQKRRQLERRVQSDPDDHDAVARLDAHYTRFGDGATPNAIAHRYRWKSKIRDDWKRKSEANEGTGELRNPKHPERGRHFTSEEYKAKDKSIGEVSGVINHAREHHGNRAALHLTPYKGHNVDHHLQDMLHASGGKSYDVRRMEWKKDAHPEGKSYTGEVAATTWADTSKETGEAFDAAFKKHYPHQHSKIRTDAVVQDVSPDIRIARNIDGNGRRFTIHPHDYEGRDR